MNRYINRLPIRRCLTVWLNFVLAVFIYAILQLILQNKIFWSQFLLSLFCWDSVGNSNWYIFSIILCYFFSYIAFKSSRNHKSQVLIHWILLSIFIVVLHRFKEIWWYDTIFAYGGGVTYALYKGRVDYYLRRHYYLFMLLSVASFALAYHYSSLILPITHNIAALLFCLLMILITYRVTIYNQVLEWLGKNLFPLYIYQRLSMISLSKIDNGCFIQKYELIYVLCCAGATLLIAKAYPYFRIKLR